MFCKAERTKIHSFQLSFYTYVGCLPTHLFNFITQDGNIGIISSFPGEPNDFITIITLNFDRILLYTHLSTSKYLLWSNIFESFGLVQISCQEHIITVQYQNRMLPVIAELMNDT